MPVLRKISAVGFIVSSLCAANAGSAGAVHIKPRRAHHRWFDPIVGLRNQPTIRCILYAESRSTLAHPNLGDTNPYQFGPFQFTPILWDRWAWVAGVGARTSSWFLGTTSLGAVSIPAFHATLYQQALVFATVARNDGLGPWTAFDGC